MRIRGPAVKCQRSSGGARLSSHSGIRQKGPIGEASGESLVNGAESLVHTLLGSGVDTCFANPGTSEMHFVAALDRIPGMHCVLALFEGVATGAACASEPSDSRRPGTDRQRLSPIAGCFRPIRRAAASLA